MSQRLVSVYAVRLVDEDVSCESGVPRPRRRPERFRGVFTAEGESPAARTRRAVKVSATDEGTSPPPHRPPGHPRVESLREIYHGAVEWRAGRERGSLNRGVSPIRPSTTRRDGAWACEPNR
jgi:hypothetical protein